MRQIQHQGIFAIIVFACLIVSGLLPTSAEAQLSGQLPKANYYANFGNNAPYYAADYKDAYKNFSRGYKSAYQFGPRRHLDSICFLTMMGECHYHVGDYAQAMAMYDEALALYLSYQAEGWQARLQLPALIQANNNAWVQSKINWGVPRQPISVARVPGSFSMLFGRLDSERALSEGGAVQNAEIYKVDVVEIMRCTALCLHRRHVIMGPIAKYDPFTNQLVTGLSVAGAGNGTLMGSYNGVLLGIALASMEDWDRAAKMLIPSLKMNGMTHSLTPVAMVELSQLAMATQKYTEASVLALDASYSAGIFGQYDLVEESLGVGTTAHLMVSATAYPPLVNAIKWAASNKARLLQASLIVKLAECFAEGGDAKTAANVLRQTKGPISSRNSLGTAVVSARLKYVSALTRFLDGDFRTGMSELVASLKHFQMGSRWLFQLRLADQLVASARITERQAELLYAALLRDPTDLDWKTDPMESLAFLASPHVGSMEVWFDIVVSRMNHREAMEIGDLVRRHRFFSYLPLGGRLMAFRWVLHAPLESLSQTAVDQRTAFLNSNAPYKRLYDRANQIRIELLALPVKPDSRSPEEHQQQKLLEELAAISDTQEAILASFALRRAPAEMVFPPQLKMSEFQDLLEPDQLALVSLATSKGYHVFLLNGKSIEYVGLSDGKQVLRSVGGLLKDVGLMEAAIDVKTLQESEWKQTARELKEKMFGSESDSKWANFKELLIVPDGVLWYLPFELLPVGEGDEEKYLSDILNIRYSPTLFMAYGPQRPGRQLERSAVVTARMHSRGEADLAKLEFEELIKTWPSAIKYDTPVRIPSNYLASLFDQLVIWSEIKSVKNFPLTMTPMQIDQGKIGTSLEAWMTLPWEGPEHVVMPGFHSDGGSGLRGKLNGNDLFLTSMGLMASGSRTALISRWATGGKSSLKLTGEYASKLATLGPARSIRAARQATRELDLDYENEPRMRFKKTDPVLKAEHPFFWASEMLFEIPDTSPAGLVDDPVGDETAIDGSAKIDGAKAGDAAKDGAAKDGAAIVDEAAAKKEAGEGEAKMKGEEQPVSPKPDVDDPKVEEKEDKKPVVRFGSGKSKSDKEK